MREGIRTTEFWVGIFGAVTVAVQQFFWPDQPFPIESFSAVSIWVAARIGQKTFGDVNTDGQRAWQTSEFWVAMGYSLVSYFFPNIPDSVFMSVAALIIGRPAVKVMKNFKVGGNGK